MTKNPVINALSAAGYIAVVAAVFNLISLTLGNKPDTAFAPVLFLSLLTLSVATMACLFFYRPLQLFIEGKKKEALSLFVRTVATFAVITAAVLILLLSGIV